MNKAIEKLMSRAANGNEIDALTQATAAADPEIALGAISPSQREFARHLWSAIPVDGSPISNQRLRRQTMTVTNTGYRDAVNASRATSGS